MVAAIVPCPVGRIGQPEVRTEVHDRDVGTDAGRHRRGLAGRQRQEDEVALGCLDRAVRLEDQVRQRPVTGQVGVHLADCLACAAVRRGDRQVQIGVPADQPEQLPAGVPAGADDRHPHLHQPFHSDAEPNPSPDPNHCSHYYAWQCLSMQTMAAGAGTVGRGSLAGRRCQRANRRDGLTDRRHQKA